MASEVSTGVLEFIPNIESFILFHTLCLPTLSPTVRPLYARPKSPECPECPKSKPLNVQAKAYILSYTFSLNSAKKIDAKPSTPKH